MKAKFRLTLLTIFSLSVSLSTDVIASHHEKGEMSMTEKVLKHHLDAFGTGDVEAILSDYTEDSFIITPDGTLKGIEALRGLFTGLIASLPPGSAFTMQKQIIEGEYAYILWSAESEMMSIPIGTDTFRIVDGRSCRQQCAYLPSRRAPFCADSFFPVCVRFPHESIPCLFLAKPCPGSRISDRS